MRKSIAESVTNTVKDLYKSGLVDTITMKNIEKLCIPEVQDYTPEKIVFIRNKFSLSQAALASIFNISPSTVQKWQNNANSLGQNKSSMCRPWRSPGSPACSFALSFYFLGCSSS